MINGHESSDSTEIANSFNSYFANIAKTLAESISETQTNFNGYLANPVQQALAFTETSPAEVLKLVKELKHTAAGCGNIPAIVIKVIIPHILHILVHLFNMSLKYGIFPSAFKTAKVIPIPKSGDPALIVNYRPISLLTIFSKLLEKIVYNRLESHCINNNILSPSQFGFQKGKSTESALVSFTESIYKSFDKKGSQLLYFRISLKHLIQSTMTSFLLNQTIMALLAHQIIGLDHT